MGVDFRERKRQVQATAFFFFHAGAVGNWVDGLSA